VPVTNNPASYNWLCVRLHHPPKEKNQATLIIADQKHKWMIRTKRRGWCSILADTGIITITVAAAASVPSSFTSTAGDPVSGIFCATRTRAGGRIS
jgi:hypothetical protein